MINRFLILSLLLVSNSCLNHESEVIQKWKLESFEGIGVSVFTFDSLPECMIIGTFLGLHDPIYKQSELQLSNDYYFQIVKNGSPVLKGKWNLSGNILLLATERESCSLKIVTQNSNSIVLKTEAYPFIRDLEITLKH